MKKVLALVVAFALCFTAFAGCFATSAADTDFSLSYENGVLTIDSQIDEAADYVIILKVSLPENVTPSAVACNGNALVPFNPDTQYEDEADFDYNFDASAKLLTIFNIDALSSTYTVSLDGITSAACDADVAANTYTISVNADYANPADDQPSLEAYQGELTLELKDDHNPADPVEENRVEAQVGVAGSYDSVVYCSDCNHEISRTTIEIPALEEEHTCEHVNAERTIKTATTSELVFTFTCECGETWDETHSVTVTTAFTLGNNLDIQNDITLNFRILKSQLTAYSDIFTVFDKTDYSTGTATTINSVIYASDLVAADPENTRYVFAYTGVEAKMMNDNINAKLYVKDANGNYLCSVKDASVVSYTNLALAQTNATSFPATLKTALVDMIYYGSKAQDYFNDYNIDNLAIDAIDDSYITQYATDPVRSTFETTNDVSEFENSIVTDWKRNLACLNKVIYNIRMVVAENDQFPIENYKLKITYKNVDGVDDVHWVDGASGEITYGSGRWTYGFDKLAVMQFGEAFTAVLCDLDGNPVSTTWTTSIEDYVAAAVGSTLGDDLKVMLKYMMTYGDSARTYFETRS